MHHFWKLDSITHSPSGSTTHDATFKNGKSANVKLNLPKNSFFPDGSNLTDLQSEEIVAAVLAVLNMTSSPYI